LLVDGATERWSASTELLLLAAARDDHLRRLILPALERGQWVLCDRFADSTRVYQGIAGGLGCEQVDRLHACALPPITPDLTVLLDLEPAVGLARRQAAGAGGRFESKGLAFHAQVQAGFRQLAGADPGRFVVIDATAPVDVVAEAIWSATAARLGLAA
jgi:dTMP kinase